MHVRLRPASGRLTYTTILPILAVLLVAGAVAVAKDGPARAAAQAAAVQTATAAAAAPNAICPAVPDLRGAGNGVDGFAKIAGVPGDSTAVGHANEIDIVTLTTCVTQTGGAGGGGGAGRPVLDDVVIGKHTDRATVLLAGAAATGRHLQNAEITLVRGGGQRFTFLRIRLQDVVVTRVNSSWLAGVPDEQVSLGYRSICWDYIPQAANGAPGAPITACFDRTAPAS
jgi:type VI secretion system secreted protein Hcp